MKASSVDLREKVLQAVDQGYPREEIVKLLGLSRATIKHIGWTRKKRHWVPVNVVGKSVPNGVSR